ncbi:Protein C25G4.2 [Aphelenchoides avenae]|nr:Protein C25G4.2 [Aphelenchus avenae]
MAENGKQVIRVLCLHGYRQNGTMFREKTGAFRKAFKNRVEFVFASAPHIPSIVANGPGDDASTKSDSVEEKDAPRAWWFSKPEGTFSSRDVTEIADGFEESVACVDQFIKDNGPFDGILGFSQGASMVHLLLALGQKAEFPHRFKFAVLFAPFASLSSVHKSLIDRSIVNVPAFIVCGESDEIVACSRSEDLSRTFDSPTAIVVSHPGGHCVPPVGTFKSQLVEFLSSFS